MTLKYFKTDYGGASYCAQTRGVNVFVHLTPEPVGKLNLNYEGKIEILFSSKEQSRQLLHAIDINELVERQKQDGLRTANGLNFSARECRDIESAAWAMLIEKYGIVPTRMVG